MKSLASAGFLSAERALGASVAGGWRPTRRVRAAVAVAALHLLLAWWMARHPARLWRSAGSAAPTVEVRLLPFEPVRPPAARVPPTTIATPPARVPRSAATGAAATPGPTVGQPAMPTAPTDTVSPPALPAATLPQPIAVPRPASPPPLDLDLHTDPDLAPTPQQQAVHDPRSTGHAPTFEERIAHDLDDRDTTERLADGSIRHRRGADCSVEHPARTSQLFPMDETSRRAPAAWGRCP